MSHLQSEARLNQMEAYQIIKQIHEAHPQLVKKMARIVGKCEELIRSHAREPKSRNQIASGNCSPVTHYLEYCFQYEAAAPGAGRMLTDAVHRSLCAEFADCELSETDVHLSLIDEHSDIMRWLATQRFEDASENQLIAFERECSELQKAVADAMAKARSVRRRKESRIRMVK